MKVIAGYLLAVLGGNASPSAKDLKKILNSVELSVMMTESPCYCLKLIEGKDITELIVAGRETLASMPGVGCRGTVVLRLQKPRRKRK